ncbi:MAG: hypothetical protein ACRDVM_09515, partial [Acidimicrobiia bacterium]
MRARNQSVLIDMLRPGDRAIEVVVARYQRVAPAVTRFARSLSGNDRLRVRLGSEAAASEEEVVCDPRLFQAAYHRNAPVTPDEVALASALHEVVHLVATDLGVPRSLPDDWPGAPGDQPVDLLTGLGRAGGPAAEALFFGLEDGRQERRGLATYPGARSVLEDLYRAALPDALAGSGGLGQFALACFLLVGEYANREALERRTDPRVGPALAEATSFLEEARQTDDPWEVGRLSLEVLEVARLHGLLTAVPAAETPAQQKTRDRLDARSIADGLDRVRLQSPILSDAESYQATRRAPQAIA